MMWSNAPTTTIPNSDTRSICHSVGQRVIDSEESVASPIGEPQLERPRQLQVSPTSMRSVPEGIPLRRSWRAAAVMRPSPWGMNALV